MRDEAVSPIDVPDPDEQALACAYVQDWYTADVDRLLGLLWEGQRLVEDAQAGRTEGPWHGDARAYVRRCHELGAAADAGYMLAEHWRSLERDAPPPPSR